MTHIGVDKLLNRLCNCRSLRCSWSIACRRCPNYIFILDLTPGFVGLGKDNCKTRRETIKFGDLVRLMLDILRYLLYEKLYRDCIQHVFRTCFLPEASFGLRVLSSPLSVYLSVSVCLCLCVYQSLACPHDNSSAVQARIIKFET